MATEIDELKELMRQNIALTEDTNRMVHKMRRGVWWGRLISLVIWALAIFGPLVAYYYYAGPYIAKIEQLYRQVQSGNQQTQNYGNNITNLLGKLLPKQ